MRKLSISILLVSCVFLSACAVTPDIAPEAAPAGNYKLDPEHTSVIFSLSHAGLSQFTGRFDSISGTLSYDPQNPIESTVNIAIDPKSVNTGLPDFDAKLVNDGKYFDAKAFPDILFTGANIVRTGDDSGRLTGDLFLKGKTNPVTLNVKFNGAGKSFGHPGKTLGFSATGTFKRSDFGMGYLTNFGIGDEITLRIETEFNEARNG